MGDALWVSGVNLADCNDELKLHEMLDSAEDYEDRKIIRARLKDVLAFNRAQREEIIRHREEEREEAIRSRLRDANEQKRRTLAMYDAMAKSAPAGGNKVLDVGILRGEGSGSSTPTSQTEKVDFVEESIRQRQRESDDRKKTILAAYDQAAKSGPAGSARFVDFDSVKPEDIYNYENTPKYTSTFQMKGGVPIAKPAPPVISRPALHPQPYDPEEAAIRRRQQEANERKRRTLQAYDKAAKSRPAGTPFSVYIPSALDIEPVVEIVGRPQRSSPNTPMTPPTQVRSAGQQPPQPQQPWARGPEPITQSQYRGPPLGTNPPGHFYQPQAQQQHYTNQQQFTLQNQHYQNRPQQQQQHPQQVHQPYGPTHDYAPQPIQLQNQYRNVPNFRPVAPHPTVANNVAAQKVTTQRQVTTTTTVSNQAQQKPQQIQPQQKPQPQQVQQIQQKPQPQQQQQRSAATVNLTTNTNQTRVGNTTTTTTTTTRKQFHEEVDEDEEEEEEESDEE